MRGLQVTAGVMYTVFSVLRERERAASENWVIYISLFLALFLSALLPELMASSHLKPIEKFQVERVNEAITQFHLFNK